MEYYLVIKGKKLLIRATWNESRNIVLSEVKPSTKGCILQVSVHVTF